MTIVSPDGSTTRESNLFTRVDRPRRLDFSSTLTTPDGTNLDRQVEVAFEEANGGTLMTIVQNGFPSAEYRDLMGVAVSAMLDRLTSVVRDR